jgi:hypothetical protein
MDTEPTQGQPQPRSHTDAQADQPNEPNEYGFAGDPTGPQPSGDGADDELARAEEEAVPAGDLTGALTGAIEDVTGQDEERQERER